MASNDCRCSPVLRHTRGFLGHGAMRCFLFRLHVLAVKGKRVAVRDLLGNSV